MVGHGVSSMKKQSKKQIIKKLGKCITEKAIAKGANILLRKEKKNANRKRK
jgi:hypothetical protein